jgi:hypothetical protein
VLTSPTSGVTFMAHETPQLGARSPEGKKGANGKYLLRTKDPQEYEITLELATWEEHIVKRHPEVKRFFDLLEKVIAEPQLIQRSSNDNETHYYYRLTGRSFARASDIYLSAVVKRDEDAKTGVVMTAHLLKEVRREGETVWMKRN